MTRKNVNGPTPFGKNVQRIILSDYMRVGDRVIMAVPDDDEGWYARPVKNGEEGVCVGHYRFLDYQAPVGIGAGHRAPGIYERNGCAIVKWDNGPTENCNPHDLVFADEILRNQPRHERDGWVESKAKYDEQIFKGPLPELPFMEGDIVVAVGEDLWGHNEELKIDHIEYRNINDKRNDGSPMPIFNVTPVRPGGGYICVNPERLKLIRRGQYWQWLNGERDQIVFADIHEEASLHMAFGLYEEVRNPSTGDYNWPASDVLEHAKAGVIDVLQAASGFFGTGLSHRGLKFRDRGLGTRANAMLIEGFSR